ncbi:MAG: MarR family winged helix-turn-helix transcriptional regulator [Acidimicrobiales bacterium]
MGDNELLGTASSLSRGAMRLVRRLHLQHPVHRLAPGQLSVLSHLHRRGPLTPSDLASADRIQPQSLTRNLTLLESEGLISRQPDSSDGRRSLLVITETGSQELAEVFRQRDSWLAAAMAAKLTPTECELLRLAGELMERLAETADA